MTELEALLVVDDVAARLGITSASFRSYVARGDAPAPDGHLGRTPYWKAATIDAWAAQRPGKGVGGGRPRKAEAATCDHTWSDAREGVVRSPCVRTLGHRGGHEDAAGRRWHNDAR